MIIEKEEKSIYQESVGLLKHQETLLFQRFNYFLLSNSFLTIAFITLAFNTFQPTLVLHREYLRDLTYTLGIAGIVVSWVFAAVNVHNARILTSLYLYVRGVENELKFEKQLIGDLPYTYIHKMITEEPKLKFGFGTLTWEPLAEIVKFILKKGKLLGPHLWLFPVFFCLVWIVSLSIFIIHL